MITKVHFSILLLCTLLVMAGCEKFQLKPENW